MDIDLAQSFTAGSIIVDDAWHEAHLSGDRTAFSRIAKASLALIPRRLYAKFPTLSDPHLVLEATNDALMGYFHHPERYDPQKGRLLGYLTMSAYGDLLNLLKREQTRAQREHPFTRFVADEDDGAEQELEFAARDNVEQEVLEALSEVPALLDKLFPTPLDRKIADMILDGIRETSEYSALLGIGHLSQNEQAETVKRNKDRIKKKVQRWYQTRRRGLHDD